MIQKRLDQGISIIEERQARLNRGAGNASAMLVRRQIAHESAALLRAPRRSPRVAHATKRATPRLRRLETRIDGCLVHALERPARARKCAAAAAPAIILIHGAGLDHRDWTFDFLNRLDPRRRVLIFDRPGFGRSERPGGFASALPNVQARLLRHAAAAFGVRQATIVGHSWGGAVAMAWGLEAPQSVVGVVSLAGAVAPWSFASTLRNGAQMRERALTALAAGGRRKALEHTFEVAFAPARAPRGYLAHIAQAHNGSIAATLSDLTTINGALALMTPRYDRFERPVELIYGDRDEILCVNEQGRAAEKMLPNARLSVLRGRGHMIHHTDPDHCIAAIERIFSTSSH
ncbi:MAG: alpha/beta hydrolase [Neomegalonema sp.]|nr:alpha/beta hydrolase [Neomegalonema sp.]